MSDRPEPEYGEWTRGNMGYAGRTVTDWHRSIAFPDQWLPMVSWQLHPDEEKRWERDEKQRATR